MATPDSIHRLLSTATMLLDRAAGEIRDAQLQPVRANIMQIGKAIAEIFEIQRALHEEHPRLNPAHLDAPDPHPESNRRLTVAMLDAIDHEERGDIGQAIATYREVLAQESAPLHREIVQGELDRLQRKIDD
jgi:hypothetical protein